MSLSSTYKPSPLSFGSPRSHPFRRPESPASPRPTTPTLTTSPSKLQSASTPTSHDAATPPWTPRGLTPTLPTAQHTTTQTSPTRSSSALTAIPLTRSQLSTDALSTLPTSQLRSMREAFQILDRANSGLVTRDDVLDMLTQLGQPSSASDITPFFPPGTPQTLSLPAFLNTLSALLAPLSAQTELLNAFAAFDEGDSGEVDVRELKDAVVGTAPEAGGRELSMREVEEALGGFVGRRTFGKGVSGGGSGRGEIFRYREWVGGVTGTGEEKAEK